MWTGSAFNCTNREISPFHGDYGSREGVYGECDNIRGQILKTVKNPNTSAAAAAMGYISQLIVRVRSDTIWRSIKCQYDNDTTYTKLDKLRQ